MKYDPKNDHYKTLGVDAKAALDEIKESYHSAALRCHPDRNGGSRNTSEMIKVNGAWEILRDPTRKQVYDKARFQHLCPWPPLAPKAPLPLVLKRKKPLTAVALMSPLINQFARKGEVFSAIGLFAAMSFLDGNNQRA